MRGSSFLSFFFWYSMKISPLTNVYWQWNFSVSFFSSWISLTSIFPLNVYNITRNKKKSYPFVRRNIFFQSYVFPSLSLSISFLSISKEKKRNYNISLKIYGVMRKMQGKSIRARIQEGKKMTIQARICQYFVHFRLLPIHEKSIRGIKCLKSRKRNFECEKLTRV